MVRVFSQVRDEPLPDGGEVRGSEQESRPRSQFDRPLHPPRQTPQAVNLGLDVQREDQVFAAFEGLAQHGSDCARGLLYVDGVAFPISLMIPSALGEMDRLIDEVGVAPVQFLDDAVVALHFPIFLPVDCPHDDLPIVLSQDTHRPLLDRIVFIPGKQDREFFDDCHTVLLFLSYLLEFNFQN